MANRIVPKKSSVVGKVPLASDLVTGEIAVNLADKLIFTKDSYGVVVQLGGGTGVPDQLGNDGMFLTTDGTNLSWAPIGTFSDATFLLKDDGDDTKLAQFDLSLITTGTARTYTLPNVSARLAHVGNASQQFTGVVELSNASNYIGTATGTSNTAIANGGTLSGATKTVTIGTAGASGSTTNITIGSAVAGSTTNATTYGAWTFNGAINPTGGITGYAIGTDIQAYDADLAAIAGLSGTTGLLRKTAANTWQLDTNTYLTSASSLDATKLTGTVATARLGTGTADSTTYLRGDGTWASVSAGGGVTSFNTRTGVITLTSSDVTDALTYTPYSSAGGVITGGVVISGNGLRFQGDFSNATLINRLAFQTSTIDGATSIFALPNGIGDTAAWTAFNTADPANAAYAQLRVTSGEAAIVSSKNGGYGYLPLAFYVNNAKKFQIGLNGQWGIGTTPDYGVAGYVLKSGGASAAPTWSALTKADIGLNSVENTALSTWTGSTNISMLGTVTSGTWNANTIQPARGGTGLTTVPAMAVLVSTSNDVWQTVTAGASQSIRVKATGTSWEAYTPGTVTSVSGTGTVAGLTLSGSVNTTGNLTLSGTLSVATSDLPTTLQTDTYAPGLKGSVSGSVTAAGSTQGSATALTSDLNIVTSSTAGSGVVMMGVTSGKYAIIVNRSGNAINVYPSSGHSFDGQAVNTPISLPVNGFLEMFGSSTTQWHTTFQAIVQGKYVVGSVPDRVVAYATGTTLTVNADTTDVAAHTNTQAAGTLTIAAPTGTPVDGQKITLRLQCTNTQTFSWNAIFVGSSDLALPTASSSGSKYDYIGFIYNATAAKWQMVAKAFGF